MKNQKSVAVICSLLLVGPAVLNTMQSSETSVMAEENGHVPDWQVTFEDNFDGEELNLDYWTIDTGNGFYNDGEWISGWGNNEDQYYHEDNVRVEDGRLILEAREEYMEDEHGEYDYTSGKILTRDKFYQAYGRFEASMKLPDGQGFWPAFWMMPQDDTYGGWAASGEIDIMENAGSETDKTSGAIHYGGLWPNNTYTHGEYDFTEGSTTEFNTYAVEWEPEEIRWYVNDELFFSTSEWHTAGFEYPAPFNQDFFLILNLAVGGWFGGAADETTEFPAQVEVDYVRVYEDANADYDTTPSLPREEDEDDGLDRDPANWESVGENLIVDGSFEETTEFGDENNLSTWNLFNLSDHDPGGGKGNFSIVDDVLNVEIEQVGWNWWQIQLFQNLTLSEGTYKLSFDMSSELERDMRLRLEDSGEGVKVFSVNEGMDTYEIIFHVQEADDFKFLFGFGQEHDEEDLETPYLMTLDNVALHAAEFIEAPAEPQPDDEDGEWVYIGDNLVQDGTFEQTTEFGNPDNLMTWNVHNQGDHEGGAGLANFSVVDEVVNAEIQQVGWDWWHIQLFQDVNVPAGTYKLSFDMASELARNARVELVDSGTEINVFEANEDMDSYEFILEVSEDGEYRLLFGLGRLADEEELSVPYTMLLDNVSLRAVEFVPAEEDPVDEDPVDEDPTDEDPVDEDPTDEDPVDEDPVDEDPVDEDPVDDEDDTDVDDETDVDGEDDTTDVDDEDDTDTDTDVDDETDAEDDVDVEDEDSTVGERLPETATAIWTVGALGLTGLVSGVGIKYFKRK